MVSFKELLKSQESRLRAEAEASERRKERWEKALFNLMTTIKGWLAESDPKKFLKINDHSTTVSNNRVDRPPLPGLDVQLGNRAVLIRPISRDDIGPRLKPAEGEWSGRVDMLGNPFAFELWLFVDDKARAHWDIRDERNFSLCLLSKETFENALVELFS